jgi:hypothetical protein
MIIFLAVVGFLLGAILGAALGVGAGLLWTNLAGTSCFEGYCGLLVFTAFMPVGLILGGLLGAIGLGRIAARK